MNLEEDSQGLSCRQRRGLKARSLSLSGVREKKMIQQYWLSSDKQGQRSWKAAEVAAGLAARRSQGPCQSSLFEMKEEAGQQLRVRREV